MTQSTSGPGGGAPIQAPERARLLVVDDDVLVGSSLRRLLSAEHDVVVVTHGQDALDRIGRGERFDLVLCDLMMPDLTGMDVFEELERSRPDLAPRVVFITGGAFTPRARAFLERIPNTTVDKPFNGPELKSLVRERLRELGATKGAG